MQVLYDVNKSSFRSEAFEKKITPAQKLKFFLSLESIESKTCNKIFKMFNIWYKFCLKLTEFLLIYS